jgi:O-methyltransferase involved in polyketide biosynthesis
MTGEEFDWSWANEHDDWVPPPVDTSKPSVARMYDYGLGGKDNYPIDREAAERFFGLVPEARELAPANRRFLEDAVKWMAAAGIRQFVDLGAGIPTSPSVHETAWQLQPEARIVYVDNDPIVLAYNRALLGRDPRVLVVEEDLRRPDLVLAAACLGEHLDLTQPVGILMIAVLHFVDAKVAAPIVARYLDRAAPGSRIALTTLSSDGVDTSLMAQYQQLYEEASGVPLVARTRGQIVALLDDARGICLTDVWRSPRIALVGAVAERGAGADLPAAPDVREPSKG